jgi:hypothetical protein
LATTFRQERGGNRRSFEAAESMRVRTAALILAYLAVAFRATRVGPDRTGAKDEKRQKHGPVEAVANHWVLKA